MKRDGLEQILLEANEIALASEQGTRPWPIIMLATIGAWLAALPVMVLVGIFSFGLTRDGTGVIVAGGVVALAASAILCAFPDDKVVEQLAFPFLIAGVGLMAFGFHLERDLQDGAIVAALIASCAGIALPHSWQRTILGVTSAALLMIYVDSEFEFAPSRSSDFWRLLHIEAALWLLGREVGRQPRVALRLQPFFNGWLSMTLIGLVYWSGPAFLTPGALYRATPALPFLAAPAREYVVSLSCMIASAVVLMRALPALRQAWCLGIAITLAAFACFIPGLGVALLIGAFCVADGKYGLASAAALVAAWTVGSAYYDLGLPLHQKAMLFVSVGVTIIAFCWKPLRALRLPQAQKHQIGDTHLVRACIGLGGLATLAIANATIVRNEIAITKSEVAYIELGAVDPRSLMQGDYMRINFRLPPEPLEVAHLNGRRALVVAQRGNAHKTKLVRWQGANDPLRENEFLVELDYKGGRWILASDAWFFREGDAERYAQARYGEFRITPSGRALLVGLRGPNLEPL